MGFCPQLGGVGPCPAQCVWQGSGFAADQTNAMLAVVRADDESLVPPQAAGLALSVARPLPTETASLGFGGTLLGEVIRLPFCIFGVSVWGWYHYPRCSFHAIETLDARGSRRRIRRFYAAAVLALCGLYIPSAGTQRHPSPEPRTQRLTGRNTGRSHRLRHRQGR